MSWWMSLLSRRSFGGGDVVDADVLRLRESEKKRPRDFVEEFEISFGLVNIKLHFIFAALQGVWRIDT